MARRKTLKQKIESLSYNHIWLRFVFDYGGAFIITAISALVFAFGMNTFINPTEVAIGSETYHFSRIISGGASGIAQTIAHLLEIFNLTMPDGLPSMYSIFYLLINIPLIILAFKGIGVRFGAFTLLNVGMVFLFTNVLKGEYISNIALFFDTRGGIVSRALFAGIATGLSSALAYKIETSAGGLDIIFYYLSLRKNTTAGKYGMVINAVVVTLYSLITGLGHNNVEIYLTISGSLTARTISSWDYAISMALFSVIYLFTVMLIVDFINVRNKKAQVQIITSEQRLPSLLLANIPHGATVVQAKGAYSGGDRLIIYMVISTMELKNVIKIVRELDPNSFVNVTSLQQVYGNFFLKPVK